ncbi:hypothetical protein AB1Y20_006961 [Prymnesium parvum]|uniref:Uncharacterized protein n=1 Tax=Prymnesium parvum TaxID=97485 RepID=A0AB34IZX2_PRYPA
MRAPTAASRQTGIRRSSRGEMEEEAELTAKVSLLEMRLQEKEKEHDELLHHHRRLEVQRAYERRKNEELTATIAFLEAKVEKLAAGPTRADDKAIDSEPTMSVRAAELAAHVQKLYEPADLPTLFVRVLNKKLSTKGQPDLVEAIRGVKGFKRCLKLIHKERDASCAKHLKENVFCAEPFSMLRLCINMSKREAGLIQQTFKYRRVVSTGKKFRTKMNKDSMVPAPEIFSLPDIIMCEKAAMARTKLSLNSSGEDRRSCAHIDGPYALDQAIWNAVEANKKDQRNGGMASSGDTLGEAWIINIMGDGAQLTISTSGVRIGISPGNTEMLNQSSNDVTDIVLYQASSKAEHYLTLKANLSALRPALSRLHRTHELRPGGWHSGKFVKLCLVSDKPFLRHVCGLKSHNSNEFGAPGCNCGDKDLYNFNMCKESHYGQLTYATLCHRAHVPLWMALGEPEPDSW